VKLKKLLGASTKKLADGSCVRLSHDELLAKAAAFVSDAEQHMDVADAIATDISRWACPFPISDLPSADSVKAMMDSLNAVTRRGRSYNPRLGAAYTLLWHKSCCGSATLSDGIILSYAPHEIWCCVQKYAQGSGLLAKFVVDEGFASQSTILSSIRRPRVSTQVDSFVAVACACLIWWLS
jgi:hypothetical protein